MSSLQHSHVLNAITALTFYQSKSRGLYLFAGEGQFLKAYEFESNRLVRQVQVFVSQTIHGIFFHDVHRQDQDLQLIIWGGLSLVLLSARNLESVLQGHLESLAQLEVSVSDWIIDAAISPWDTSACALVTAHNTILHVALEHDEVHILSEVASPSRSILYSAHVIWDCPDCVLIAAGTVFGEIIVWKSTDRADFPPIIQVLFTFSGHEGSIFGVNISANLSSSNFDVERLLVSCSDDRTIRIWDISDHAFLSLVAGTITQDGSARETGFRQNRKSEESSQSNACIAVVMGHASRIWGVKFHFTLTSSINVFSFGEDSTVQQWTLDHRADSADLSLTPTCQYVLKHQQIFAYHSGKHVWSSAMHFLSDANVLIATGGSDGKIASYVANLSNSHMETSQASAFRYPVALTLSQAECTVNLKDINTYTSSLNASNSVGDRAVPRDGFNRYAFITDDQMVLVMTSGRVLVGELSKEIKWHELSMPESCTQDLKSYAVVKGVPEISVVFLGSSNGNLLLLQGGRQVKLLTNVGEKIADIFATWNQGALWLMVTTLRNQRAVILRCYSSDTNGVEIMTSLVYTLPEKFIATSVGLIHGVLLVGSRTGTLVLYNIANERLLNTHELKQTSEDAITSIIAVPTRTQVANPLISYFLLTSRNGTYSIYSCTLSHSDKRLGIPEIQHVHHGKPPFGPIIEAAWFQDSELLMRGFKSKDFVVWNETQQVEVMRVECGGAHRSSAYMPLKDTGGGRFVYTKASSIHFYSQKLTSHCTVQAGGHGREIKACALSQNQKLIATGAEDTSIKIWSYEDSDSPLHRRYKCLTTIQKHTAGIQHLQWPTKEYLFSSGGNEEFYIWAITTIPGFGVGITCEASCPDQSEDRDLRIMTFDVIEPPKELRLETENILVISLAYSDSKVRTYTYSRRRGYVLVAAARYTTACLTQIQHLEVDGDKVFILTGSTDGNLSLWRCSLLDTSASHTLLSIYGIHQNSIKSMAIRRHQSYPYNIVALGGDDNAISIAIYNTKIPPVPPQTFILRSAHGAAITGLCFVDDGSREQVQSDRIRSRMLKVVSSSNDQRVKEWIIEISIKDSDTVEGAARKLGLKMSAGANVFTSVADVAAVEILHSGNIEGEPSKILIIGNGMEVFSVDGCNSDARGQ